MALALDANRRPAATPFPHPGDPLSGRGSALARGAFLGLSPVDRTDSQIYRFSRSRWLCCTENGHPKGYGFYVLEDHKGLIGGLFVSSQSVQSPVTQKLLGEMLNSLRATPRLQRIEAQLMPFGTELDPVFLSQYFRLYPRQFMLLPLAEAKLTGQPLSAGLRLEPWSDRAFEAAARLIHLAYADHVDSQINDQYCSEAGGLKFLRNIVLLPGCGQFLPEASFLRPPRRRKPPHRHGAHLDGRRTGRPHHADLRHARLSRPQHRQAADGERNPGAAAQELRISFTHGHFHEQTRRRTLRTSRLPRAKNIRGRRLARSPSRTSISKAK